MKEKPVLTATEAGIVRRALGERRSVPVVPDAGEDVNDGDDRSPAFALLPKDRAGVAVPVLIGGEPLVAVYADGGTEGTGADGRPLGVPVVEVLASHAGARLEAVAAERAAAFARDAAATTRRRRATRAPVTTTRRESPGSRPAVIPRAAAARRGRWTP